MALYPNTLVLKLITRRKVHSGQNKRLITMDVERNKASTHSEGHHQLPTLQSTSRATKLGSSSDDRFHPRKNRTKDLAQDSKEKT